MSIQMVFFIILSVVAIALIAMVRISRARRNRAILGDRTVKNSEVYVGNLNYRTEETDLERHFAQYGKISEVKIIKNNRTGRSKGYAFIRYTSANEAEKALSSHGAEFNSRSLVVRIAKSEAHG